VVTYDVYFGANVNPPTVLVSNDQAERTFNPGLLTIDTIYYWKIVATDEHGASTEGPVWGFSTRIITANPMVYIPAGEFLMGCDPAHNGGISCMPGELPLHAVYLDAYSIDKYEVTNAQYARCMAAGACTKPGSQGSSTRPFYLHNLIYADYPVIWTSWSNARDYCQWAGKRLPTEAEWEKAARGALDTRAYPWGDQNPDCTYANFYDTYGSGEYCGPDTSAVGSYPVGSNLYGALDMAGNVAEWVNDWYDPGYYSNSPLNNPPGPSSGSAKVLRGGGWIDDRGGLRVAYRRASTPDSRETFGFRCALSP
jgi:formylglycine-generating enzyme required for sulfatase activity